MLICFHGAWEGAGAFSASGRHRVADTGALIFSVLIDRLLVSIVNGYDATGAFATRLMSLDRQQIM